MNAPTIGSPLLVPFDGSARAESALPYVPLLAGDPAEIILLQVIPEPRELRGPRGELMLTADQLRDASETAARADLGRAEQTLLDMLPDAGIRQVIVAGDPAEKIAEVAAEHDARTILLSSQGVSAAGTGGFSSVASRLARTSSVPLVVIRAETPDGHHPRIERFVVAHDGSERASRVLEPIASLSRRLNAHVHVVCVIEDEQYAIPAMTIDPHVREEVRADARVAAQRQIENIGADLLRQGLSASWEIREGPAAPSILETLTDRDLLVCTSHGRGGTRWALGSVAEKLVREAPSPVLLLRTAPTETPEATT